METTINPNIKNVKIIFQCIFFAIVAWLFIQLAFENQLNIPVNRLNTIDWIIWSLLSIEYAILCFCHEDKSNYLIKNWLNILIIFLCFPLFWFYTPMAVYLRCFRFLLLIRFFIPSYKILKEIFHFNYIGVTLLMAVAFTVCSGILMKIIDPSFHSIGDGIWWAWETITTVGYGDEAPSTTYGRLLAIVVMVLGAALFSIITASLSAYLVHKSKIDPDSKNKEILNTLKDLQQQVQELSKKINTAEK